MLDAKEAICTASSGSAEKRHVHQFLSGNFAPVHSTLPLTPCESEGQIPKEFAGGQYVRNGSNPVSYEGDDEESTERAYHWFDGDGMLSGVFFRVSPEAKVVPEFVNQYVLTDAYLSAITTDELTGPITPSIATLVDPRSGAIKIVKTIFRSALLILLSHFPGSKQVIKKISVGNTSIIYHDGRALALCESGPPMRMLLPTLDTVGWFDGVRAEGEPSFEQAQKLDRLGKSGMLRWMHEWTTAHPKIDSRSGELIAFHSIGLKPFVEYTVLPCVAEGAPMKGSTPTSRPRIVNAKVPGIKSPKMMHDFGASAGHSVIMDLPLSLDPSNLAVGKPIVAYDYKAKSRFGVFPRHEPEKVVWYETKACCIFHTANTWDEVDPQTNEPAVVNMLACRLTSASLLFAAGDIVAPGPEVRPADMEEDQCRLYYYAFERPQKAQSAANPAILYQFALCAIPFEFPAVGDKVAMRDAQYVYGTSGSHSMFDVKLAAKIDCLVKVDVRALIGKGKTTTLAPVTGCVDNRTVAEILESQDENDPIKIFKLPTKHFAQESRFVPREGALTEDDGWLVFYVFDESQLDDRGNATSDSVSELWILDAKTMNDVVAKIKLPQRVPYGLHGTWFPERDVVSQRPVDSLRAVPQENNDGVAEGLQTRSRRGSGNRFGRAVRRWALNRIG
jgi:carotenoid cleavage dioxygenase-like enzyme